MMRVDGNKKGWQLVDKVCILPHLYFTAQTSIIYHTTVTATSKLSKKLKGDSK